MQFIHSSPSYVDNHFSLAEPPLPLFKPLLIQHLTALLLYTITKTKMSAANCCLTHTYASANLLAEAPDNSQPRSMQTGSTQMDGQVTGKRGKVQPASKTSTDLSTDVAMTDVVKSHLLTKPSTAKGKYVVLPPQSPNPMCASHVTHPGAPDIKCGRWTTAEVMEAAKCKEEAHLCLEMLEKEKLEILVKMEVDEELEDEAEE